MATNIHVDAEFIKLSRQFLTALKEASMAPTPRAKQRAENLKKLFEAKLSAYEKQLADMETTSANETTKMF